MLFSTILGIWQRLITDKIVGEKPFLLCIFVFLSGSNSKVTCALMCLKIFTLFHLLTYFFNIQPVLFIKFREQELRMIPLPLMKRAIVTGVCISPCLGGPFPRGHPWVLLVVRDVQIYSHTIKGHLFS